MSLRHHLAVSVATEQVEQDFVALLNFLLAATNECKLMGTEPLSDAAVLVLSAHVAFMTGTDTPLKFKYPDHLQYCFEEVNNDLTADA